MDTATPPLATTGPDPSAPAELTIIIVSYNTRALTLRCLETLYAHTHAARAHVVVWDNQSADGSADAVAAAFPQVELVASDRNLGFAAANNIVARQARTEWLLLLNPDTEVHEGAIDALLAFAKSTPHAGITGGRTVFPDGSLNIASCWNRITPWSALCMALGLTSVFRRSSLFNPEQMGDWRRDTVREVDIVVGCFLMIPRALWNRMGGFDPKYVMYGEEADLCLRARHDGYRPMITPEAQIMHLVGASAATRADKVVMVAKARTTLMRDHWPAWQHPAAFAIMWLWGAIRMAGARLLALRGGEKRQAAAAKWANVWARRAEWLSPFAPVSGFTVPGRQPAG
ncbi:glycosyltransferase family 2 protein [Falsirhodobacter sp. 20TX0035]|uniref:glycosyltransferase family 2 protein n=1 Tax=Falsirhodobacter sp. 20TX0035 TaxID=3022019 RepID=UPI002330378D|nr:glycosyltransferase family 2 protein [Falsirhodobacter sp. 20TX0035]MDB6452954.1 glycosyltransferase family 2 protein [Falsirhodobacter sp. 20TX0035]